MAQASQILRFDVFEADLRTGELRKNGSRIKLPDQPFRVLAILLSHPFGLVTREELRGQVWPEDTFVDFDHAVNTAVTKIRVALGDDPTNPRFIETIPRRGYRFICAIQPAATADDGLHATNFGVAGSEASRDSAWTRALPSLRTLGIVLCLFCLLVGLSWLRNRYAAAPEPEFRRLSFGRGMIYSARFTPDGQTVIYGAAWNGQPIHLFWTRVGNPESRSLGVDADILAISSSGEMAVLLNRHFGGGFSSRGTLALMSLAGSAPRKVLDDVRDADWSPDGSKLLVTHYSGDHCQLEYPLGKILYQTAGGVWISHPRISPHGDQIAFLEHPLPADDAGYVAMVDLMGKRRILSVEFPGTQGLAWTPSGDALWFSADAIQAGGGGGRWLFRVTTSKQLRLVRRESANLIIHDIARDESLLLTRNSWRDEVHGRIYPEQNDRELGWFDNSFGADLTPDGSTLLLSVQGEAAGRGYEAYIRSTRAASKATRLGEGFPAAISPDGTWVVTLFPWGIRPTSTPQLVLLPTGAGQPRTVTHDSISHFNAAWFPDGKRLLFVGNQPGRGPRSWVQNLDGSKPSPITPEGTSGSWISPDGKWLVARDAERRVWLYPLDQGKAKTIFGVDPEEEPIRWSGDDRYLFVAKPGPPAQVSRVEITTGRREFLYTLGPSDPAGVFGTWPVLLTADGKSYVYSYLRVLSDLYMVSGIK